MTFLPIPSDEALSTSRRAWLELKDELVPWIGERAFTLFCYSISRANRCENDALAFRRALIDSGDAPENPEVTEAEQLLVDWGRLIVTNAHDIPADFYARLEETFSPERRLTLLAFAGQMLASNLVNTVGRVPLDPALEPYRASSSN
ncbi:hypothetical protein [Parafrigoribacterium soli]|uniref:hypothetical protein n=1 Tax=Parafrigoribacterium soli TaxID=3144663 RepID=UPI0032EC1509